MATKPDNEASFGDLVARLRRIETKLTTFVVAAGQPATPQPCTWAQGVVNAPNARVAFLDVMQVIPRDYYGQVVVRYRGDVLGVFDV